MSILKNLFNRKKQAETLDIDHTGYLSIEKGPTSSIEEMFEQHAGLSFEKQTIFADVIGKKSWELDMGIGAIKFDSLEFPIQIIGSLAFSDNSWMWAWANTASQMPQNLLQFSNRLREIGRQQGIGELTDGGFIAPEGFEHKIGMVACGIFQCKSYYSANYGQGTLVVTIDDGKIPPVDFDKPEKILTTFPLLISRITVNHRNALKNYLVDRGFKLKISEDEIEGLRNNSLVTAKFNKEGRLESLNGKLG